MKTPRILALLAVAAISNFAGPAMAQSDVKEQLVVPMSEPGKPGALRVNLIRGSIRVTGHAANQVVIDATSKREKSEAPKDVNAEGMKRISKNNGLEITATEEHNNVRITTTNIHSNIELNIKVPLKCSLKVGTINEGEIVIENVEGEMEITNVNGGIRMTNVAGSAVANTVNGTLKANFKTINQSPMAFSTLNGNVDVTLPPTAKFNAKLKSDRGEIYTDFDVDVDRTVPAAEKTAKDGMYKVSVDDWVKGKVNGGGGEIMMKNMNGNIYVRKAK